MPYTVTSQFCIFQNSGPLYKSEEQDIGFFPLKNLQLAIIL